MGIGGVKDGLYYLVLPKKKSSEAISSDVLSSSYSKISITTKVCNRITNSSSICLNSHLWNQRVGHIYFSRLRLTHKLGFNINSCKDACFSICPLAKQTTSIFPI